MADRWTLSVSWMNEQQPHFCLNNSKKWSWVDRMNCECALMSITLIIKNYVSLIIWISNCWSIRQMNLSCRTERKQHSCSWNMREWKGRLGRRGSFEGMRRMNSKLTFGSSDSLQGHQVELSPHGNKKWIPVFPNRHYILYLLVNDGEMSWLSGRTGKKTHF